SSKRTWPRHASAARTSLISSDFPRTTASRLARKRDATSIAASVVSLTARAPVVASSDETYRRPRSQLRRNPQTHSGRGFARFDPSVRNAERRQATLSANGRWYGAVQG